MPRGDQVHKERKNHLEEQHQNVQGQLQQEEENFGFEDIKTAIPLTQQDNEIMEKLDLSAYYLNEKDALPKLKALNNYMKTRIKKDWIQTSDEFAQISAKLYSQYEKTFLKTGTMSNWEKLEAEAEEALRGVQQRDETFKEIRKNANIMDVEQCINELLADRNNLTDSKAYTKVWNAADAYMKMIDPDPKERAKTTSSEYKEQMKALNNLLSELHGYASLRYKTYYHSPKGKRRMNRITKLIALTGSVLEVEPTLTVIRDTHEQRDKIGEDLDIHFSEDINKLYEINANALPGRWADILLPYERDDAGQVTAKTRANYEDNWETIQAFKSDDDGLRLAVIAKLYQRLTKFQTDANSYQKDAVNNIYKQITASKNALSLYAIFTSVVQMERNRYNKKGKAIPAELTYMEGVMLSAKYCNLMSGMQQFLMSYGFDANTGKVNTKITKKQSVQHQNSGRLLMDLAKAAPEPDIRMDMEEALQGRVNQLHQNQQHLETLRQDLQERDANHQPNVNSVYYLDDMARCIQKHRIKSNATQQDLETYLGDFFDEQKVRSIGGINPLKTDISRMRDLMLMYERGADGNITLETHQNFQTNLKLLRLFISPEATDRIAGIAYIYLNLKRTYYTEEKDWTKENMLNKYRGEYLSYPLQQRAYNTILDIIAGELDRTKDNALLNYMDKQTGSVNMCAMRQLGSSYFKLQGYNIDGKKIPKAKLEEEKVKEQKFFEGYKANADIQAQIEREENNGQFIMPNVDMEAQLRKLCQSKGLM